MASTLSDDDFQRLQTQLIDLKTSNYSLEESNKNLRNEIGGLQQKLDSLEVEHQKAQKTISKSKKIKEVESLIQENDNLQLKLQSQEDEFRLQNSTLMEELNRLLNGNERLEKELQITKQNQANAKGIDEVHQNETRRTLAENSTLKKLLQETQLEHEKRMSKLKKKLSEFITANESLNETVDDLGDESAVQADRDDYEVVEVGEREVSYRKSWSSASSAGDLFQTIESKNDELESLNKELAELKFLIDTEREEKRMLQEEMEASTRKHELLVGQIEGNVTTLMDKLKKKQESLTQLQGEKEKMYEEHRDILSNLRESKDLEIHELQDMSHRLQTQLKNALSNIQEVKEQTGRTIGDLEHRMSNLHSEVDIQANEKLKSLEADRIVLQSQLANTKVTIERIQMENGQLGEQMDTTLAQSESLLMRFSALEEENSVLTTTLDNLQKTADKRKTLLDEMAIHLQTKTDDTQREIARIVDEYTQQINVLGQKLADGQTLSTELEKCRLKNEDLETEIQSLECTRGWFERRLNEAEESLQITSAHYESTLMRQKEEHETKIAQMVVEHEVLVRDLGTQLEIANAQKAEFEESIAKCEQETRDALEDRKIHDKKGASIVKDLKRQLQIERRRSEVLQERLQELLNESSHARSCFTHLAATEQYKPIEVDKAETCSISSWSMMSGGGNSEIKEGKEDSNGTGLLSLQNGNSPTPSSNVVEENEALVAKCVALQEGKSDLEERLNYLEESNATMAQEMIEKTAIIQYYCMKKTSDPNVHGTVDKLTVKRVLDFIKDRGDENQRKINHRLQRILEEYLTKNMHLQKDMDALSKENELLRGMSTVDSIDPAQGKPESMRPN